MSSTRIPSKAMQKIANHPMLYYVIKQTLASKYVDDIIIATTCSTKDNPIVDFCKKKGFWYFRGSEKDVLDRYYKTALKFKCDPVVRISSDCPLIDPKVIDSVIEKFLKNSFDYACNNLQKDGKNWKNATCNFPQGMTIEISTLTTLEKAWKEAKKPSEREHVFPYVQFNPNLFKIVNITYPTNLSYIRCTVDRKEDLEFIKEIFKLLDDPQKIVHIEDIVKIVDKNPHLLRINNFIDFEEGYKKSLLEDKHK